MNLTELENLARTGAFRLADEGDGIVGLVFDLPNEKVNKLTALVLEDLERLLDAISKEPGIKALIVLGGKESSGTFIAGADINEIRAVTSASEGIEKSRRGQTILGKLSTMPQVTLAAIHGTCLGGGTELALWCDFRLASHSPRTRIGLPEVQLGILPGFGGTQRLPRLVGIELALPLILTGKPASAAQAAKIGLVDRVVYPGLLLEEAKALANKALSNGGKRYEPPRRRASWLSRTIEKNRLGRALIRKLSEQSIQKLTGGHYPAPYKALDAVVDGFGLSLDAGLALEASLVGDLIASPISKCLIDLFLSNEEARRGKRFDRGRGGMANAETKVASASAQRRVGLLGAGVMGGGIAALLAQKGYRVRLKDIAPAPLTTALAKVHELYSSARRKGKMSQREVVNYMAAISLTTEYSGFGACGTVIEAVVENMEVKKQVLREVEATLAPTAILATNTSALSVTEMQSVLANPARFVGLHFFNPVHKMPLVEVIRGRLTSEDALAAVESLARDLGKVPVRVEDAPGFLVNRLLAPYLNEAALLLEEGYSYEAVDLALRAFGMPMGPFELLDEVGLDVAAKAAHTLHAAFGERLRPAASMERLVEAKLFGKKCGKGFYLHGGRRLTANPTVLRVLGLAGKGFLADDAEIWIRRLIYPIINEAVQALSEKVVERPSCVDLAMVMGTGFAPFRGGPLRYADAVGVKDVVSFLESTGKERHKPAELLKRLATDSASIYDLEKRAVVVAHG